MNTKLLCFIWAILFSFFSIFINTYAENTWVNLAENFWIATQWTQSNYAYYWKPSLAIDGDINTYNHTDSSENNWLQIEVPGLISVSKISIQSRSSWTGRIKDAKVYILNKPFAEWMELWTKIWTLKDTADKQDFIFDTEQKWKFIFVKARTGENLHIAEVEIYGTIKDEPIFSSYKKDFTLSYLTENGTIFSSISAIDLQNDTISYSLSDNSYFSISNEGKISTKWVLPSWTQTFKVIASDWVHSSESESITVNITDRNSIELALSTWKINQAEEIEILSAISNKINEKKGIFKNEKIKIFNLNNDGSSKWDNSSLVNIDWDPTHDAATFFVNNKFNRNSPLLTANAVTIEGRTIYEKNLAVLWKNQLWGKYVVFWWNPFRNGINSDMQWVLENTLSYLTANDSLKTSTWFNVVLSHMDDSYYFRDESKTREWLDKNYTGTVTYNKENTCDNLNLANCITNDTDLIIISQLSSESDNLESIISSINWALSGWIPVIYIHHDWDLKPLWKKLFSDVFDIWYEWDNRWKNLQLKWFNPAEKINILNKADSDILKMITHFQNNDLNLDWSVCEDSKWNKGENNDRCGNVPWYPELKSTFNSLKSKIDQLDRNKINIFEGNGYDLQKLFILLADKYREKTVFPMNKATGDDNLFMKSYYSDHLVYNFRWYNPVQNDLWNFSRSDFSHITPVNKSLNLVSKRPFRSAWVYALPGETFTVTRRDDSDVIVKIFINSQRSWSTHEFQKNWYSRPKFLQSQHIEIKRWETISLTSPYGWPIQVEFSSNDLDVALDFTNIGEHAYWKSINDNDSFTNKLEKNEYDWAEIATPGFEVHSQLNKMVQSIWEWKTPEKLAAATTKYIANYPLVLAWFKWPWIDIVDEIHDFAHINKLNIYNIDQVKHMNADQATCGYGCSWNPYDAYWAFSPVGHGDIHEVGHGLEKSRFRFTGFEWHSTTNPYSYYTKSNYNKITKWDPVCQSLPFQSLFETVKESKNHDNALKYLQDNFWSNSGWSQQFSVTIQAMMHAEKQWKLKDGWHLLARLHILERNIGFVKSDWENKKNNIWFSNYSLDEFNAITNDDWMLISLSYAVGLDYSEYLKMIWMNYSDKALAQVKSFNYPIVEPALFISTWNGYCKTDKYGSYLNKPSVKITKEVVWPTEVDVCENWDYTDSTIDWECWKKPESGWWVWIWWGGWGSSYRSICLDQQLVCKKWDSWIYKFYRKKGISCKNWNLWKTCDLSNSFDNFEFNESVITLQKEDKIKSEIFEKVVTQNNLISEKQEIIKSVKTNLFYVNVWNYKVLNIKNFKKNNSLTHVWKVISKKRISIENKQELMDSFNTIVGFISVYKDSNNKIIKQNIATELKSELNNFNKLYKKSKKSTNDKLVIKNNTDKNSEVNNENNTDNKNSKEKLVWDKQKKWEDSSNINISTDNEIIESDNSYSEIYKVSVHSVQLKYDRSWQYTNAWLSKWDTVKVIENFNKYGIWKVEVTSSKNPRFTWRQWFISNKFLNFN